MRVVEQLVQENKLTMEQYNSVVVTHMIIYRTDLPKCFVLPDAGEHNPYHLLFYMIARFYFLDNGEQAFHYYYPKREGYLIEKALEHLPSRFIRHLDKSDESFEYSTLPSCLWYNDRIEEDWIYGYIKNLYKPIWSELHEASKKKLFISRDSTQTRSLLQEKELVDPLRKRGFSFYDLEKMTFEDQIHLFASASIVLGTHGAGLSWIVFCEKGTKVCEIAFEKRLHYKSIADQCELEFLSYDGCTRLDNEKMSLSVDHFLRFLDTTLL